MTSDQQRSTGHHLHRQWVSLWNGDLRLAQDLIAARFTVHLGADASVSQADVKDAAGVARWVAQVRGRCQRMAYHVVLGPMVDQDKVITCWQVVGHAKPEGGDANRPFTRVGVDILRFNRGRVEECWTLHNTLAPPARWRN